MEFRVVLPSDELLRVECSRHVTVASLRDFVATAWLKTSRDGPVGAQAFSSPDKSIRLAPHRPETSGKRVGIDAGASTKLTLVRSGVALDASNYIVDATREMEILELCMSRTSHDSSSDEAPNVEDPSTPGNSSPKSQKHRSPESVTRRVNSKPHKGLETTRRRGEPQSKPSDGGDSTTDADFDAYPLLRGGLELVRRLLIVKEETRKLVLLLRDAEFNGSNVALDQLLPPVTRIAAVLYQADGGATLDRWRAVNSDSTSSDSTSTIQTPSTSEPGSSLAVQTLAQTIGGAGAASRGAIVMQGWVVSTEWRGIWRHQYAEYACLCDDHTLSLFPTRQQCVEHIFELNRSRDGHASETSARILKSSAPRRRLSLSDGEWVVRRAEKTASKRGDQSEDVKEQTHRQALAFFDQRSGDMRLILDVSSPREAEQWTRVIQTELDYSRLYLRMRDMHDERGGGEATEPLDAVEGGFSVPLRWLHARVDRLDGNARSERLRSRSFAQALKDLQRDQLAVNGVVYPGANVERVLVAISRQLLALMDRSKATLGTSESFPVELNALCFARQLVVSCSRTHGGGDILDTLHLMFNKQRYCICPDTQQSSPVKLRLESGGSGAIHDGGGQMSAEISLSMAYKVVRLDVDGNSLEDSNQGNSSTSRQGERRIVAVYRQKLVGAALEWREADGSVSVAFA